MAKTIAILNHKGGVGKTTTAINLGAALQRLKKKVLVVDVDPQANASYILGFDKGSDTTVFDALIDKGKQTPLPRYEYCEGLDLCPASEDLKEIDNYLDNRRIGVNRVLKTLLRPCQEHYDYIIIDCPPSLGILTINAMTAADSLIVCADRKMSVVGITDILKLMAEVQEDNENLKIEGYLLTRYRSNLRTVKEMRYAIMDNFTEKIFNARISESTDLSDMADKRQTIFEYAPKCAGARDYEQLAREIVKSK